MIKEEKPEDSLTIRKKKLKEIRKRKERGESEGKRKGIGKKRVGRGAVFVFQKRKKIYIVEEEGKGGRERVIRKTIETRRQAKRTSPLTPQVCSECWRMAGHRLRRESITFTGSHRGNKTQGAVSAASIIPIPIRSEEEFRVEVTRARARALVAGRWSRRR